MVEDRFQLHPVCSGDVLSVVTQIVTIGPQDAFLPSKDSLSPFRHRLRIALTPAAAIEGDGGRGDIPFGEPELSSSSNDNYSPIETGDEPQLNYRFPNAYAQQLARNLRALRSGPAQMFQ